LISKGIKKLWNMIGAYGCLCKAEQESAEFVQILEKKNTSSRSELVHLKNQAQLGFAEDQFYFPHGKSTAWGIFVGNIFDFGEFLDNLSGKKWQHLFFQVDLAPTLLNQVGL
jgi:hypothetical protein